jgi:hypothetical protein
MAAGGQLGAMENALMEQSSWTRRVDAENSVAGAGAPHKHDVAASQGVVALTTWWSNRLAWKPSSATSSVGVHLVELQSVRPWVGPKRSSIRHTTAEGSHSSSHEKPRDRSAATNNGVHALAISDAVQHGWAVVEK